MHTVDFVYMAFMLIGCGYTVMSLLAGVMSSMSHHVGGAITGHAHHGLGHDLTHGSTAHGHAHGHANGHAHAHHDASDGGDSGDSDDASGRPGIMAYLNPMFVSGFFIGSGVTGLASRYLGIAPYGSIPYSLIGGFALWAAAFFVVSFFFGKAQGSSHHQISQVVGLRAQVIVTIEGSKPGMVSFVVGGNRRQLRAITDDDDALAVGSSVRIRRVDTHTAYVTRIDS